MRTKILTLMLALSLAPFVTAQDAMEKDPCDTSGAMAGPDDAMGDAMGDAMAGPDDAMGDAMGDAMAKDDPDAMTGAVHNGTDAMAKDDKPLDCDAMGGDAMEGDAMEGDTMEGDAMEGDAMDGDAMEGDAMEGEDQESSAVGLVALLAAILALIWVRRR